MNNARRVGTGDADPLLNGTVAELPSDSTPAIATQAIAGNARRATPFALAIIADRERRAARRLAETFIINGKAEYATWPCRSTCSPSRGPEARHDQDLHSMTSDSPDGQQWPPPTDSSALWVIVRRANGCTLWRAIQLVYPPVADIATAAEKIRAHLWADRLRGRAVQAAGLPGHRHHQAAFIGIRAPTPNAGRPLRRT